MVKICNIETFQVGMPLTKTFTSGNKSKNTTRCLVVRVTADDGTVGISSVDPSTRAVFPDNVEALDDTILKQLVPLLMGENPTKINRILNLIEAPTKNQLGARAGIELACIDLTCRLMNISLCQYLGGPITDTVLFNGWVGELPPDEAKVEAMGWQDLGFKSLKIKVGSDLEQDIARINAIYENLNSSMKLRIDANEQYTVEEAKFLCDAVKNCDLQLFEQPIHRDNLDGLFEIRKKSEIPIMADESVGDHESLIKVLKADCADIVKFGLTQAGGMTAASKMIASAEAANVKVVVGHGFGLNLSTMAEIMLGATSNNVLPGLECVGPLKVTDTVTNEQIDISSGKMTLKEEIGVGMTLNDSKLSKYALKPI